MAPTKAMDRTPVIQHFLHNLPDLLNRDYILDIFTLSDYRTISFEDGRTFVESRVEPFAGQLVYDGEVFCRITHVSPTEENYHWAITVEKLKFGKPTDGKPLLSPQDECVLKKGMISNHTGAGDIHTTVGRVFINYLALALPFGDKIPYMNETIDPGNIEKMIGRMVTENKTNTDEVTKYTTHSLFISGFLEFVTPTLTKKTLMVPQAILDRKAYLLKTHAADLAKGKPEIMIKIEKELVDMFKAYLKGDPSMIFLRKGSYFSNIIKRFFLTLGTTEEYGNRGNFVFLPNSLEEGWTTASFSTQANEIRAASYGRSMEVAKGGEESNFIKRIFQNTRISEQDCKTRKTLPMFLHKGNLNDFMYRNILINGKVETLAPETIKGYLGKVVLLRSPGFCATKGGGYCYTCMGKRYESIGQDKVAAVMNEIGGQMSQTAMKAMHDTTKKSMTIHDLNAYVLQGTL